ncbi:fasciclin domain-containing protein [Cellulomonas sp. PhB143]|uniref:fasciclin domain-containing protein n=1 Tax=Cellulomonas sp. PhB143 TaxID=2485186 RepID=UPI000F4A6FD3|nr:fasciclin domain-containing protein [Cellulomonas sp. PhB143]ROS75331.1 fasciclin domain-containing protein [Cellulomonas sp. PhB143]
MNLRRTITAATAALVVGAGISLAPAASAAAPSGTTSLAEVLASDGDTFDRNWYDYDVLDQAVAAVLKAKPDSPVAVLADGTVPLTAFLPNDRAFQLFALDLTHRWYTSEASVLTAIARAAGIDAVEQVLLYHVVPGATVDSATALASNGARLTTAQGGDVTVRVLSTKYGIAFLQDKDRNDLDPWLVRSQLDLNKGNVQIAHGISLVLRPANL